MLIARAYRAGALLSFCDRPSARVMLAVLDHCRHDVRGR